MAGELWTSRFFWHLYIKIFRYQPSARTFFLTWHNFCTSFCHHFLPIYQSVSDHIKASPEALFFFKHQFALINHTIFMKQIGSIKEVIPKLDGVGPVDNTPYTNKLDHFVQKKMWHVTCDMWHLTCDTWHMTCDLLGGVNILSKFQLPSSFCLWSMILWRFGGKGWLAHWIN